MAKTRVFRGFSTQINGLDYRTRAEEIEIPDPKFIEGGQTAGYIGTLPVALCALEKMEAKIKINDCPDDIFLSFGLTRGRVATVIATAAIQAQGSAPEQVLIVLQGIAMNGPGINYKNADYKSGSFTLELALQRYSLTVNKIPIFNIDIENNICIFGAYDFAEEYRNTLMI